MKEIMNGKERKEDEENRKMVEGAKEFSRRINGLMSQVADLERRMIRLERMHVSLGCVTSASAQAKKL